MGISRGVTLVVGGGFHGKSTLLEAISRGIYTHIPGDGRECVATDPDAVKVSAEDGRRIERVDISSFISDLPGNISTKAFRTENASGSTSQAANIAEPIEVGARVLLLDEDNSATNFLIRDARMQMLVAKAKEPITPFIDMVRLLYEAKGISTIIVLGGAGDYFDVADTVIAMEDYLPHDVTEKAREIARTLPAKRKIESEPHWKDPSPRKPDPGSLNPRKGKKDVIKTRGLHHIQYGSTDIDISYLHQLTDGSQTRAIAEMLRFLPDALKREPTVPGALGLLENSIRSRGIDSISAHSNAHPGDLAYVRRFEVAGALNRLRLLEIRT